ncbi:MAG: hypothetical protein Kow0029_23090 [Candidatus Rifleibacteriota bacterium]
MSKKFSQKKGFTLVEILIAAGVLTLFLTGLFSFYRMGSRMFVTGSWKLQKQKETERFLSLLKERIEQASNASAINPAGAPGSQLVTAVAPFVTLKNNTIVTNPPGDTRLMLWSVCKPDMSRFGATTGVPGKGPGLILYHCLLAKPAEKNLYTLYLHANTQMVQNNGIDYFNSTAVFYPDISVFSPPLGNFTGSPKDFSLQTAPFTQKLTDVLMASFSVEIGSGTSLLGEADKVVGISIVCQHPQYDDTTVSHSIKAKIDYSVQLDAKDLGGF